MISCRLVFSIRVLVLLFTLPWAALPWPTPVFAQPLRIEVDTAAHDLFRFRLANVTGNVAALEGSLDLVDWFTLDSTAPQNAHATLSFTNQTSATTWFFRAVQDPGPGPGRIVAQVDTNLTTGTLLTPEGGGTMLLEDSQGITYQFTAAPNLVWEPVAVHMTLITNFTTFPDHDGARAAVQFSPEGLAFRGAAELRITFPSPLTPADMLAYSFADDGGGFHLQPSRPGPLAVTMPITHFSGHGVGRVAGAPVPTFDQAWAGAKSAILAAEQRQALRDRAALREHYVQQTITEQQLDQRFQENDLRKLDDIYRSAVKPFERAGETDCAIGQAIVMGELDRLAGQWAKLTGQSWRLSPYFPKLVEFAPKVRCACAHRLIERCEAEPGVSGSAMLRGLDDVLLTSLIYTARTDAQGCDLGSDDQIRARLAAGACFKLWEGSIRMTRVQTKKGSTNSFGAPQMNQTYDNEIREIFRAEITRIDSEDIFIDNDGRLNEFWTFKLAGPYSVGYRQNEVFTTDLGDMVYTSAETADASIVTGGEGDTTLLLLDGKFEALGPGGGTTSSSKVKLPLTFKTKTSYYCKTPRPPNNPCPKGTTDELKSSYSLFQGYFVGAKDPGLSVTTTAEGLSLTWKRHKEFPQSSGPPEMVDEEIVVTFRRTAR